MTAKEKLERYLEIMSSTFPLVKDMSKQIMLYVEDLEQTHQEKIAELRNQLDNLDRSV